MNENDQLQQSADRFRDAVERAEQQLDRIQTPEQRAAIRRRVCKVSWPWRSFRDWHGGQEFLKWHWFPDGKYQNAVCGHAPIIGLYYVTSVTTAETPDGKSNVCPDCLAKWDARQAKTG